MPRPPTTSASGSWASNLLGGNSLERRSPEPVTRQRWVDLDDANCAEPPKELKGRQRWPSNRPGVLRHRGARQTA
jgi:hypothetical protein